MDQPKIIIKVEGGVVQAVYADQPVEIEVIDLDNEPERDHELRSLKNEYKQYY